MQIAGTVKVEATVAPNGKVKSTKAVGGSPVLTKAALDAIEAWKWAATSSESKELIELSFHPN
jgi:TonB family protein